MHGVRFRRVARVVVGCVVVLALSACHGSGAKSFGSTGSTSVGTPVDVKSACAALEGLEHAGDELNGVNLADPDASSAALDRAITAYAAALSTFERVGPANLRATAAAMRIEVIAHHFGQATTDRTAIDAWEDAHCTS